MNPYRPSASAKIKISIMPVKSLSCCEFALMPAEAQTTCISDDADREASGQTRESAAQAGAEVRVGLEELVVVLVHVSQDDDRHDQTVQTQDTGQDDWNDGLDDEVRSEDGDRADAEAGLGGSVGASEVWSRSLTREYKSCGDAHESEESCVVVGSVVCGCDEEHSLMMNYILITLISYSIYKLRFDPWSNSS